MGFCSLQHMRARRSTSHGFACPLRYARRVWLPSRRFTPFEPVSALFHADSAHGIHPSELSPHARYPTRYRSEGPTYRSSCRCSRCRSTEPARQAAVPGLYPLRESLAAADVFSIAAAGCSHGFHPSRVHPQKPWPGFRPTSSPALRESDDESPTSPAPQSINRLLPGPALPPRRTTTGRTGRPF
jgi:hypothetical protein